jgi:hypothetical protein
VSGHHDQCSHRAREKATRSGIINDTGVDGLHDSIKISINVELVEGEDTGVLEKEWIGGKVMLSMTERNTIQ